MKQQGQSQIKAQAGPGPLDTAVTEIRSELARVDSKAGTLLTLAGAALTGRLGRVGPPRPTGRGQLRSRTVIARVIDGEL
ncbi:hypothetical protein GCM10010201_31500 [Pilimelia columellifera subsp. columellifera]|uniref:Uncharacterized protein n=1 Tax=Pilimelia columellifera subsp. columellifera TaxID=706583 RepID=A0ABP6AZX8_9ACTN